jgi:hypothetical protein
MVMSLDDLLMQLSPDVRERGQQFERVCKWYLENAPEYRSQIRQVWLWNEWPQYATSRCSHASPSSRTAGAAAAAPDRGVITDPRKGQESWESPRQEKSGAGDYGRGDGGEDGCGMRTGRPAAACRISSSIARR